MDYLATNKSIKDNKVFYNDVNDMEHYPIREHHIKSLEAVINHFSIDDAWYYSTTIHGVMFRLKISSPIEGIDRLSREDMELILSLSNVRWIEALGETFVVAMTHYEGE